MSEPVYLDLGIIKVPAEPAKAYAGYKDRVYSTERAAIIDRASNELAEIWLKSRGASDASFSTLLALIEHAPDVAEAAVKLARFKLAQ